MSVTQWFQYQAADFYNTGYKIKSHGISKLSISELNMFQSSSTLAVCVPINLSITLDFVSLKWPRESYLVDAPHMCILNVCSNANPLHDYMLRVPRKADR